MKKLALFLVLMLPLQVLVLAQKASEYYSNGQLKSVWKTDTLAGTVTNYFYFETGQIKSIGIFDATGLLLDFFHLNKLGDTIGRSHIPEFKAQPKKDLSKIRWTYAKDGIGYAFDTEGTGNKIEINDSIKIRYIGYFEDGGQFDNSYITGYILNLKVGAGRFLKSFENGLCYFKAGQKGYIKIPPALGYGSKPASSIPPNSTLIYEIAIEE